MIPEKNDGSWPEASAMATGRTSPSKYVSTVPKQENAQAEKCCLVCRQVIRVVCHCHCYCKPIPGGERQRETGGPTPLGVPSPMVGRCTVSRLARHVPAPLRCPRDRPKGYRQARGRLSSAFAHCRESIAAGVTSDAPYSAYSISRPLHAVSLQPPVCAYVLCIYICTLYAGQIAVSLTRA